jgi:hypothetical protein
MANQPTVHSPLVHSVHLQYRIIYINFSRSKQGNILSVGLVLVYIETIAVKLKITEFSFNY